MFLSDLVKLLDIKGLLRHVGSAIGKVLEVFALSALDGSVAAVLKIETLNRSKISLRVR